MLPTSSVAVTLALALGLILLGFLLLYLRHPIIAKLGVRNIPRRPLQSALIVVGLTLSTTIIVAALSLGDTLDYSVQRQAVDAYGAIDQVISPAFLGDLLALAEEGQIDPATAADTEAATLVNALSTGDLASIVALFQDGLPGIPEARYLQLKADVADEPLIDGVAGSILFPTIVRNVNTGQGEPLGFIFAVDDAYATEFGLHSIDGSPLRMADLQPGVGNIFVGATDLFAGLQQLTGQLGAAVGLESVGVTEAALAIAAIGALLTAPEGPAITLRQLSLDVATLRGLGFDTSFFDQQGIETLSLEALGIDDQQLSELGLDPDAPITLPTLRTLGLDLPDPAAATTNLLGAINLNTLGSDIDRLLQQYGLQLRQGDLYLGRLGAQQLNARPGDLLEIFIGPIPVPYRVRAVVEESGPLGALWPVVMMELAEAQKLLFMAERINSILISNQGDNLTGIQYTDAVSARLRALSLNAQRLQTAAAVLRRPAVAEIVAREAPNARNPEVDTEGAPQFLVDLIESMVGVRGFGDQVALLATAVAPAASAGTVADPEGALREALGNGAVRRWVLDLPIPEADRQLLAEAFRGLEDFQVLTPLSKQFALQGASIAGVAFGTIFSISGTFSILAGVLLIFLIFVMMAAERRSELGIARAVGMQRGHLVQMFVTEGLIYDLAAALLGLGLGLLVAYGMIGFLGGLFANLSQQLSEQAIPFRLRWSVAPASVVIAYCLGVLITFMVVTVASWRVSRLNIVAAIRDLPDTANGRSRRGWRGAAQAIAGPATLLLGGYLLRQGQEQGQTVTLVGITLLLVGGALLLGWLLGFTRQRAETRQRLVYTLIGLGLVLIWAVPWNSVANLEGALFRQNPAFLFLSFVLSGPLVLIGAIMVVMFNADRLAGWSARLLGGIRTLTPVLQLAIAYPLANRFRTSLAILLFAMVITTVTVMSIVIQATTVASTPSAESTAGFEVVLTTGLLSFFAPVIDLQAEAAARPDFPREQVAVLGSVSQLQVEGRQQVPESSGWLELGLTGIDAGYAEQAATVYGFQQRAAGFADDAAVWEALATRDDVAVVAAVRVADRPNRFGDELREDAEDPNAFGPGRRSRILRLQGFALTDAQLPPVEIQLRFGEGEAQVTRTVQVIGVLANDETLAEGSIQVNRSLLDALNGAPVRPERFYVRLAEGVDQRAAAQALERAMLSSGLNATLLAEQFAAGQAVIRGVLSLFQGFLALGLVVGIAGLGVISSRTVVERRQQVGMLRAIGYRAGSVALLFVLESSFIALTGILAGAATGLVLGDKMIGQFYTLATAESFPLPWLQIGGMLLLAYSVALLTTILPAWQASRIYPAEALRYE